MTTAESPRWMDTDLALYRDSVRRFVAAEVEPHQARWREQQHVDRALWNQAGELGLLLADVPDEYGGSGGSFAHMAILFEELAFAGDRAFGVHVHAIAAQYLLNHGTEEQKRHYLPRLASGEMVGAIAMSEPGAGSDLQGVRSRAIRDAEGWVLDGTKTFISNGYLADLIIVVARTDAAAGSKGISLMLVETRAQGREVPGFRVGRLLEKMGQKGQDTCELFFDGVRLAPDAVLGGTPGRGFAQLMSDLPYERTLLAVSAQGAIERALALTVDHARQRKAFGQALIEMQNTRFKLAEIKAQAVVGRAFVDDCIVRMVEGRMDTATASIAKLWLSETEGRVIDECLQLFGGYGYMLEYPIAQMYLDTRVQRIYGGTSEIMKEIIARSL